MSGSLERINQGGTAEAHSFRPYVDDSYGLLLFIKGGIHNGSSYGHEFNSGTD